MKGEIHVGKLKDRSGERKMSKERVEESMSCQETQNRKLVMHIMKNTKLKKYAP